MTEQEKRIQKQTKDAIEVLGFLKKDFENKAKPRCKFARVRAGLFFGIKALEKQIPKKPNKATDTSWGIKREVPVCPVCDYYLTQTHWLIDDGATETEKVTYCETCGQAINWE